MMSLKIIPIASVLLLVSCSSVTVTVADPAMKMGSALSNDTKENSQTIVPINTTPTNSIPSSNNKCMDNFDFLRRTEDPQYPKYSAEYIKIIDGYRFLKVNKNIMGEDAARIYAMALDKKMNTLCSEVNYISFQIVQKKIKEVSDDDKPLKILSIPPSW